MKDLLRHGAEALMTIDGAYNYADVEFAQFIQVWGSTALGFGGIGGSMMTPAVTTVVFKHDGSCDIWFNAVRAYNVKKPNEQFHKDLQARNMLESSRKKEYEQE